MLQTTISSLRLPSRAELAVLSRAADKFDDEGIGAASVSVVLNPEGGILAAVYSTRVARLTSEDAG
jgi:hypothetical protein